MPTISGYNKRSVGINLIGWGVCVSNILLFVSYYYTLLTNQPSGPPQFITFLSILAVFPRDFFHTYMDAYWSSHLYWMLMIIVCAMGILLLNKFARLVFIVMNISHIVVLGYLTFMRMGHPDFVSFVFKLYLNLVVCSAYVGFLIIPDVREQFERNLEGIRFKTWMDKARVKTIKPQDSRGLFKLGLAYNNLGRFSDAIAVLEKAVALEPENADYRFRLGQTCGRLNRNAEAIAAFNAALRVRPDHYDAWLALGECYLKEGSVKEGCAALEKALAGPTPPVHIYRLLGEAYFSDNRFQEAAAMLEKGIQLNPRDHQAFYQLGVVYGQKLDRPQEARDFLLKAVRLDSRFVDAYLQLGLVCIQLKRHKDAIRYLKEVIKRENEHKLAHYHLGFAYATIMDFQSAKRHYWFLKNIDPDLAENLGMMIK